MASTVVDKTASAQPVASAADADEASRAGGDVLACMREFRDTAMHDARNQLQLLADAYHVSEQKLAGKIKKNEKLNTQLASAHPEGSLELDALHDKWRDSMRSIARGVQAQEDILESVQGVLAKMQEDATRVHQTFAEHRDYLSQHRAALASLLLSHSEKKKKKRRAAWEAGSRSLSPHARAGRSRGSAGE